MNNPKYAVIGPMKGINRVTDNEPQWISEDATAVQITDEQAATIEAGKTSKPPVFYFLIDGTLKTLEEKIAAEQAVAEAARLAALTPAEKIQLAEAYINQYFSAFILLDGFKRMSIAQAAGTLASIPKTVAVATWVETVKQTALAGSTVFPPAPFTAVEVLAE